MRKKKVVITVIDSVSDPRNRIVSLVEIYTDSKYLEYQVQVNEQPVLNSGDLKQAYDEFKARAISSQVQ